MIVQKHFYIDSRVIKELGKIFQKIGLGPKKGPKKGPKIDNFLKTQKCVEYYCPSLQMFIWWFLDQNRCNISNLMKKVIDLYRQKTIFKWGFLIN